MVKKYTIEWMRVFAEKKKGECLSKRYKNSSSYLKWRCSQGHIWKAIPNAICRGQWCKKCADDRKRFSIQFMQELAEKHGGKCLSREYIDISHRLKWECKNSHKWVQEPRTIVQGHWCDACFKDFRRPKIEQFQKLAKEKGAKCLTTTCENVSTILNFVCKEGHTFQSPISRVNQGHWCPKCAWKKRSLPISEIRKIAKSRGGQLLSKEFINENTPLKWKCKNGHIWKADLKRVKDKTTRNGIKVKGTWCKLCSRDKVILLPRYFIGHLKNIAQERKGECLSDKYEGGNQKHIWRCKKGHVWKAVPYSIFRGSWCPYCAKVKKQTIEDMQRLAKFKGGLCLSSRYVDSLSKLTWMCKEGHKWRSTPNSIKHSWCPVCGLKQMGEKHRGLKKFEPYSNLISNDAGKISVSV